MHAHEPGPIAVGLVERGEGSAVGVGAAGADEDGAEAGVRGEVGGEGGAHGEGGAGEVEGVGLGGAGDEGVDFGEGVGRDDVDGLEGLGGRRGRVGGLRVAVEAGEEEDEEDEAVFAAVVGHGEFCGSVSRERVS